MLAITTEWHQEEPTRNRISKNDLAMFRAGWYEDASEDIKKKWCMTMKEYLPKVNGKYASKMIRMTVKPSQVTSVSDEALVMWILYCYVATWEEEVSKGLIVTEETDEDEDNTPTKKSNKKQGKHHSVSELSTFMKILENVDTKRKDIRKEAQSWEEAVKEEAMALPLSVSEANQGERMEAKAILKPVKAKAKFVMPYY